MIVRSINDVLKGYSIGLPTALVELTGGLANLNYKMTTPSGHFLLRFCKQQPIELIEYEVQLLTDLKALNFPTSYPLCDLRGSYIHHTPDGIVMIYEFLEGEQPRLNENVAREMGAAIGLLGTFVSDGRHYKENAVSLKNCLRLEEQFDNCPNQYPDIFKYFIKQTGFLKDYLEVEIPKGIVHGDLFPNNTIFQGEKLIGIIDFEEAAYDHLLFDVGMGINGFCFRNNRLDEDLVHAYLKEYLSFRELSRMELELLPFYIQWGAHGIISWHLKNDLLHSENPFQLSRVRELMTRVQWLKEDHNQIVKTLSWIWASTVVSAG